MCQCPPPTRPASDGPLAAAAEEHLRAQRIAQSLKEAGAGVILKPSRGEHGTVFVTGRDGGAGAVPTVTLSAEHYNMIAHMMEQNIAVEAAGQRADQVLRFGQRQCL